MTSRKLLVLLDGLPPDSWYKYSVQTFIEEVREAQEDLYLQDVRSLIFAQLHGQQIATADS